MLDIIERAAQRRQELVEQLGGDLEAQPLHLLMRKGTWRDHRRAENSDFEVALVRGEITREAYADLLVQMLPVYGAIERRARDIQYDALVAGVHDPRLERVPSIERDLTHFLGTTWAETAEVLPVTAAYVERIETVAPARFVAHHYCRYLADLSGGVDIYRGLADGFGDPVNGLTYYDFSQLGDLGTYKDGYRSALSAMALAPADKLDVIEEVAIAYAFNIEIVAALATKHRVQTAPAATH